MIVLALVFLAVTPVAARPGPYAAGHAPTADITTWTHVGTGPLLTSTALTGWVRYPSGIQANDLLILSCQGKRNAMRWSAPQFERIVVNNFGPAGLRFMLLTRLATGGESGTTLKVRNTTGINGWSCAITAFRGGVPTASPTENLLNEPFDGRGIVRSTPPSDRVMRDEEIGTSDIAGWLTTHWFVSSDDNAHGQPSHGALAFGGPAYDTTVGTDHAASMTWHVGTTLPCWPPEECSPPPPNPYPEITMRQVANGPDAYLVLTAVFAGCDNWAAGPICP
jgi:hypothetical protein